MNQCFLKYWLILKHTNELIIERYEILKPFIMKSNEKNMTANQYYFKNKK